MAPCPVHKIVSQNGVQHLWGSPKSPPHSLNQLYVELCSETSYRASLGHTYNIWCPHIDENWKYDGCISIYILRYVDVWRHRGKWREKKRWQSTSFLYLFSIQRHLFTMLGSWRRSHSVTGIGIEAYVRCHVLAAFQYCQLEHFVHKDTTHGASFRTRFCG